MPPFAERGKTQRRPPLSQERSSVLMGTLIIFEIPVRHPSVGVPQAAGAARQ